MSEKKSSDRDKLESALSELFDVTAERDKLRKAFALACKYDALSDGGEYLPLHG